jgi:hypothetical protein
MCEPQIVCILGMGRSGTSLVSRLVNLLDVELGPEEHLMKANEYNARGYWEHQLLTDLNDEVLSRLGGTWHEPPAFLPGWESGPQLADLRERARAIIRHDFAAARRWGWKDPRTCLTLPFWQCLLSPMQYVICLRSPIDVASSLHRRDGFSFEKGFSLWLFYTRAALAHTVGHPRLLIFYEDVLEDWRQELQRLAAFLGKPGFAEQSAILQRGNEFVDAELQHHRTTTIDVVDRPELPFPAKALYLAARLYVDLHQTAPHLHTHVDQNLGATLDAFSLYAARAQQDLDLLLIEIQQVRAQVMQLKAEKDEDVKAVHAEMAEKQEDLQWLRAELREKINAIYELQRSESYRLGLFITWPLRKVYHWLRRMGCETDFGLQRQALSERRKLAPDVGTQHPRAPGGDRPPMLDRVTLGDPSGPR